MMQCFWSVYVDAKTRDKAANIAARLESLVGTDVHDLEIEPYEKTGHKIQFTIQHDVSDWTAMVFDVILTAQRFGYQWIITGGVDEELSLTATNAKTQGIAMLTCWCSPSHEQESG